MQVIPGRSACLMKRTEAGSYRPIAMATPISRSLVLNQNRNPSSSDIHTRCGGMNVATRAHSSESSTLCSSSRNVFPSRISAGRSTVASDYDQAAADT